VGQYSVKSLTNIRSRKDGRKNERMTERKLVERNGGRKANSDGILGFISYNAMIYCV
jgi:hypothetical protein